MVQFFDSHGTF